MKDAGALGKVACLLVVIGALNWGLVGLGYFVAGDWSWNVVHMIVGSWPVVEALVYLLVGLSGIWKLVAWGKGSM